uniref:Uncharacterized protein n=1 Tax=Knipowitschia caucasica TaxID=637954 RepID=A0AAV2JSX4_KNICA
MPPPPLGAKGALLQPLAPHSQLQAGCKLHFFTHLAMLETDAADETGLPSDNSQQQEHAHSPLLSTLRYAVQCAFAAASYVFSHCTLNGVIFFPSSFSTTESSQIVGWRWGWGVEWVGI